MSRDRFGAGTEPPSEVAPGVHRIEGRMGDNRLCLYALRGERTLLVDSGLRTTPAAYILPHPDKSGLPERVDQLLISHSDTDHHGGSAAVRESSPGVEILCHELDQERVESKGTYLRDRYEEVVADDDFAYAPDLVSWLSGMIGEDDEEPGRASRTIRARHPVGGTHARAPEPACGGRDDQSPRERARENLGGGLKECAWETRRR